MGKVKNWEGFEAVRTITGKCRRCYSCIRNCPAKAIKVEGGQARVLNERCIACGYCVRVCSQKAKAVHSEVDEVMGMVREGRVVAILAPSFVVQFYPYDPGKVVAALRALGFAKVYEVACGADLVTREYIKLLKEELPRTIITTPCPAVINLVEKHYPRLIPMLSPIVSPMVALGRAIKARDEVKRMTTPVSFNDKEGGDREENAAQRKVVFIGPCIAKKEEAIDPDTRSGIDGVLTFKELKALMEAYHIDIAALEAEEFDGPRPDLGRIYPISGGLLKSAAIQADVLQSDVLVIDGKERCLEFLEALSRGRIAPRFVDILFCEGGCVNGPMLESALLGYTRHKILVDYYKERKRLESHSSKRPSVDEYFPEVDLRRTYSDRSVRMRIPAEDEIVEILKELDKKRPEDELNCGACGYATCREKAIAVYQGLAENKMCLPYLIDQLEKNNQELEYLKEYNKNIVESITTGVVVIDTNRVITTYNNGHALRTEYDRSEVIGRNLFDIFPYLREPRVQEMLNSIMKTGERGEINAFRYRFGEGRFVINIKGYPLTSVEKGVYGVVLICDDISEEEKLKEQLIHSEKLASVGQLAAGVAHEINNPLSIISGYCELLKETVGEDTSREYVRIIEEEAARIADIVRNLLSFVRVKSSKVEMCDVNHLLGEALNLIRRQLPYKGISLITKLNPSLPQVLIDPSELEQVFLNIIMNSVQAMAEGGGTLEVLTAPGEGGRFVRIEFRDTGIGIPEENLHRIFDPFFTTKKVGEGTGLGLYICYNIIKKYNGSIYVQSEVGEGTTFIVELPVGR